jgi:hypothetical protein
VVTALYLLLLAYNNIGYLCAGTSLLRLLIDQRPDASGMHNTRAIEDEGSRHLFLS